MKFSILNLRSSIAASLALALCACSFAAVAQAPREPEGPVGAARSAPESAGKTASQPSGETAAPDLIDLPTALRLAGANNLDVSIAEQRLAGARADHLAARQNFFPWISPGFVYRRHDGNIQAVEGTVFETSKQSYTAGAALTAKVELGPAWYQTLAAKQRADAAGHQLETQRLQAMLAAAAGFFELSKSQALVEVANEAVRIATEHEKQLVEAVDAGLAFKGDLLRVKVQTGRAQLGLRQSLENQRIVAARLAETLRLDATVVLRTPELEFSPVRLIPAERALDSLVGEALARRPEINELAALVLAAEKDQNGARYGPWVPELGANVYLGGLGGGVGGDTGNFDGTTDYQVFLGWRLGPGGLFDRARIRGTESRLEATRLSGEKVRDAVTRQVVEAHTRAQSLGDQIQTAQQALEAAEETFRLSRERKQFGVGVVLENIQAEQELTRARSDYLRVIAEFNQSQYLLTGAIGALPPRPNPASN